MITFDDRGYSQNILPRMYPSNITDPKMLRERAEHKLGEWEFFDLLRVRFGLIDQAEFDTRRKDDSESVARHIETEVVPLERSQQRKWWQFWRRSPSREKAT